MIFTDTRADMSPFGAREDDPLLQDDPLAPSGEKEQETSGQSGTEEGQQEDTDTPFSSDGGPPQEEPGSVFAATTASSPGEETSASDGVSDRESGALSRADLLSYLLENRAALDVLFEMMAFDRAEGDEEEYRHFLNAMRERHEVAIQQYQEALEERFSDVDLNAKSPSTIDDEPPMS